MSKILNFLFAGLLIASPALFAGCDGGGEMPDVDSGDGEMMMEGAMEGASEAWDDASEAVQEAAEEATEAAAEAVEAAEEAAADLEETEQPAAE